MQTKKLTILIFAIATLYCCATTLIAPPNQAIYLFKDIDGLYLYDPALEKETLIFDASDKHVFLDEQYQLINDTLTFGFNGDLTFTDSSGYHEEKYYHDYYSVDLKSGNSWLSRKVIYEVHGNDLNIKKISVDVSGRLSVLSDTSMVYQGSSSTSKGITYNNFKPRFFSKHTLFNKSVFSLFGNIYYTDKSDTTLLVEYKGRFDSKFGSGYFQPQFDPSGQFVVYQYLPGLMNFKEEASLQKINIQTKQTEVLKIGKFSEPTFSSDGKFILFKRDQKQGKYNTWISKIYLLDLITLEEQKIGNAYSAQWVR